MVERQFPQRISTDSPVPLQSVLVSQSSSHDSSTNPIDQSRWWRDLQRSSVDLSNASRVNHCPLYAALFSHEKFSLQWQVERVVHQEEQPSWWQFTFSDRWIDLAVHSRPTTTTGNVVDVTSWPFKSFVTRSLFLICSMFFLCLVILEYKTYLSIFTGVFRALTHFLSFFAVRWYTDEIIIKNLAREKTWPRC